MCDPDPHSITLRRKWGCLLFSLWSRKKGEIWIFELCFDFCCVNGWAKNNGWRKYFVEQKIGSMPRTNWISSSFEKTWRRSLKTPKSVTQRSRNWKAQKGFIVALYADAKSDSLAKGGLVHWAAAGPLNLEYVCFDDIFLRCDGFVNVRNFTISFDYETLACNIHRCSVKVKDYKMK